MTLNDLTINPSGIDFKTILSDWEWLLEEPSNPVLLTCFGDVFVQGASGKVYFIDTCGGKLVQVADDGAKFDGLLSDVPFVTQYLYPNLHADYRESGMILEGTSCYSYKQAPVLGGADELENVEVTDFSVHFSLMGQTHRQVKDLPEGTSIGEIKMSD